MDADGGTSAWLDTDSAKPARGFPPVYGLEPRARPAPHIGRRPLSATVVVGILRALDLGLIAAAALLALPFTDTVFPPTSEYIGAIGVGLLVAAILLDAFEAYDHDYIFQRGLRTGRVLAGWAGTVGVLLSIGFALKTSEYYSRVWGFSWFLLTPSLLILERVGFSFLIRHWVRTKRLAARTVIVGASEHGQRLAAHLDAFGDIRTHLLGFVDDRQDRVPTRSHGHDLLGNLDHLTDLIRANMVDQVFIALPWTAEKRVLKIVQQLAMTPVHIRLAPDLLGFEFTNRQFSAVAGLSMLRVFDRPISDWSQVMKALEDRVGAGLLLMMFGPLMLLIALLIRCDSAGPVLFRQKRAGFNNEMIDVFKFRTMYENAVDPHCQIQTTRGDPRVTRVGRFLRAWSLDELPQLLNVLRGEMSLVGPRPHALATKAAGRLFEDVVDRYAARYRVKPGMTGWAQVNGWRGETDTVEKIRKRVEHDLFYIDHWSIWLDLRILLRTLLTVVSRKNAY